MLQADTTIFSFLQDGEMGELTRNYDWGSTPLGSPGQWPQSLQTTISILLHSKFPMVFFWGPDYLFFYNDAFRSSLGASGKHPGAFGKPGAEVWTEVWDAIKPALETAFKNGESSWTEDQLIPIERNGIVEDVYWTYSFSPVKGEAGKIIGVLGVCNETTDKIRSLQGLERSQESLKYRKALLEAQNEAIPDAILIVDTKGNMISFNRHFSELWEIPSDITDRKDDAAALQFAMTKLVDPQGFIDRVNYYYAHPNEIAQEKVLFKDGRIIERFGNAVIGEDGVSYGWAWLFRDITEQRLAVKRVEASEERFRKMVEQAPVAIGLTKGREMVFESINEPMLAIINKTKDIIGKPLLEAIPEIKGQPVLDILYNVFDTGEVFKGQEVPYIRGEGANATFGYYNISYTPLFENGKVQSILHLSIEVTDQVLARKKIEESEQQVRSLIESAPFPIGVFVGKEMRIQLANQSIIDVWGKGNDVVGKLYNEILPELENQLIFEQLDGVYETGVAFHARNQKVELLVGGKLKPVYFNYSFTPLFNAQGNVYGVMNTAADVTDLNLFAGKLLVSEQRFQAAVTAVEGIVWTNNPAGEMEGEQPGWTLLTGQTYEEYKGYGWTSAVHPDDAAPTVERWNEAVRERKMFVFEHRLKQQDGTWGLYAIRAIPLLDMHGEIVEWVGVHTNITKQRQAEQALKESELFARSIIENSPVAQIVFVGEDMVVSTVNEKMLDILGRDTDLTGHRFMDVVPELRTTPLLDRLHRVLHTGETFYMPEEEISLVRFGETYTGYYNYSYQALPNTEGNYYGVICTAYEVTDQVHARKKIQEAETSLRGAIDLAALGTWSIDLEKGLLTYDDRLNEWFGFEGKEPFPVEKAFLSIPEEFHEPIKKALIHAVTPGTDGVYDMEYPVVSQLTGRRRILHANGKGFFNSNGVAYKFNGTAQDVTEQRQAQDELEWMVAERTEELQSLNEEHEATNEELSKANERLLRSNKELEEFSYAASHDMQEPLRKIQTFSSFLVDNHSSQLDDRGKNLLAKIGTSVSRMKTIIDDLLRYSHQSSDEQVMEETDLNTILQNIEDDLDLVIQQKGATLEVGALPVITAVPSQMHQLFYNLLTNALKFSKAGVLPKVVIKNEALSAEDIKLVSPQRADDFVKIVFRDNGIGFRQEYAEQIFSLFKRLHAKTEYEGTGIGLGLCKKIVQNHNGVIYAVSEIGEGAAFHLLLPK